uniref:Protein transport protein sec16 n=1 Tax=Wuchereria bancrofti TaxID=6293 RepID=A0AAF5PMQ3_WUCBA
MSQFYWQLQTNTQQQERNDAKNISEVSQEQQQQQQQQQQQPPYWWHQQSQTGTDPYSAAVFEGFRASSGDIGHIKSWQTPNIPSTFSTQQPERIPEEKTASLEIHEQKNEQVPYSFGIHQPILDSKRRIHSSNAESKEAIDEKYNGQHVKVELISGDDAEGNVAANALLLEEKEQAVNETENDVPVVAMAQVTPMIATSIATATETSFSADVLFCNQTLSTTVSSANIARVDPISNNDPSGFSVNRVVTTLQSVIPKPQIPSLASVANSARSTPLLLNKETDEIQNTADIEEKTSTISNIVSVTNSQQPSAAIASVKGLETVMCSASNQLRKVVDSHPIDGVQEIRSENELRQIVKEEDTREHNMSTSEQSTDSTAPEDSISRPTEKHWNSKNVRDRYRIIRQQYPEVIKRLDRLRMETHNLDWRPMQKAPLVEVDENAHRIPCRKQRNSVAVGIDSNFTANSKNVETISDSRPSSKMNHSYTLPDRIGSENSFVKNDVYYGEDFVNSLRRTRYTRTREHDYFLSRGTKSEMGEIGPYRGPALAKHKHMMQHAYGYNSSIGYQSNEHYPSGRHSLGPHLGRRVAHELAMIYDGDNVPMRRPQSSFDAPYSKYQQLNEFAQDCRQNHEGEHSFESREGSSGSDSEMARIHNKQEMARQAVGTRYDSLPLTAPNEFYYFGVIQLPQERVEYIMRRLPPPPEYFQLPAIEKAAYLFYCVLYRHHFLSVDLFHKKFNREFFSYMCEGDSAEVALWKICKHTQDEYIAKRSINQLKAYEMSQKQLFSDEHETLDSRQSERGSRCDVEDDSDQLSIDSAAKEPMKFRVPHSFLKFGVGGKAIILNVQNSENILEIRDLKSLFGNQKLLRISNAIESFRGPLIAGFTPTHSVHLYIQRQIELILKSEAYLANPSNSLESDCLLIWQLLEMLVQQQGRVTGPDLSRLLMATCNVPEQRRHSKEKLSLHTTNFNEFSVDSKAYDRFTQLLIGGHIKEALESAIKDGLYSDAMILARRMCANEPQELEKVETAFLSHRSEMNPVMTLLSVANGQPAPVLTSPPMDETNSWRSHVAIVLANLNNPTALGTVHQLGCVLARRGLHAAADFCFLAVSLLISSYNPFQPIPKSDDMNADIRRHITLIHATLPGEEMNYDFSKNFSIIDLHATEIFHYSTKLANNGSLINFNTSIAYQLHRLDYAEMVSEFGNSAGDAFRYCVEIAKEIWDRHHEIDIEQLERLYELAERLKFVASAEANSTVWLPALRSFIDNQKKMTEESKVIQDDAITVIDHNDEDVGLIMIPKVSPQMEAPVNFTENNDNQKNDFANTATLGSETVKWHIGQEAATFSTIPVKQHEAENQKAAENNDYRMQLAQQQERVETYSNTNVSINPQYPSLPPVLQTSTNDSVENSITNHTTIVSPSLLQANEQISHETVQNYYDDSTYDWKILKMKQQTDSKGANNEIVAECVTDNNTSTISHENIPHGMEAKVPNGMLPTGTTGRQIQGTFQSAHLSSIIQNSELSFSSQQQSNMVKKDEKANNGEKLINDHRQNPGLFSKLKATIAKAIPSSNEMILPDDKHPSIVWDPKLNRYVGEGIEEESVPKPPPSITGTSEKLNGSTYGKTGGLTAARLSGGSRYFNPLIETSSSKPATHTAPLLPPVPASASFGFIPSMPDENEASTESPFSVDTTPLSKETENAE